MNTIIKSNTYKIGVAALLLSAIITAVSQVFYANKVQSVHPFLFTGISFFITALFFQALTMKQTVQPNWQQARDPLIKLNIASAVTFLSFYFALKYVEPAIVSSLEMAVAPLFIIILLLCQQQKISFSKWLIALGTLLACIVLVVGVVNGESGVTEMFTSQMLVGLIASVICGIGAVYCSEYSKQLSGIGWTSSMILSKRYIAIIVISFCITYEQLYYYFLENITWILIVTIAGVLLPNYLLQKGIQYTNTFLVMMSLSFIPVFTFVFQLFDTRLQFSIITLIGVSMLFVCGLLSIKEESNN